MELINTIIHNQIRKTRENATLNHETRCNKYSDLTISDSILNTWGFQRFRYSGYSIFPNIWIFEFYGFWIFWMFRYSDFGILGFQDFEILGFSDFPIFRSLNFRILRIKVRRCGLFVQILGFWKFRSFEFSNFRIFGFLFNSSELPVGILNIHIFGLRNLKFQDFSNMPQNFLIISIPQF